MTLFQRHITAWPFSSGLIMTTLPTQHPCLVTRFPCSMLPHVAEPHLGIRSLIIEISSPLPYIQVLLLSTESSFLPTFSCNHCYPMSSHHHHPLCILTYQLPYSSLSSPHEFRFLSRFQVWGSWQFIFSFRYLEKCYFWWPPPQTPICCVLLSTVIL